MIGQFKDEMLLKHQLRHTYIRWRMSWRRRCVKGCVCCILGRADGPTQLKGRTWGFHLCALSDKKRSRNPWAQVYWRDFKTMAIFPVAFALLLQCSIESPLLYASQTNRNLINTALQEDLSDEDQDEMIYLLDRLDVTAIPTQENLKSVLLKVAQTVDPKAKEKISLTAGSSIKKKSSGSPQDVLQTYENKKPTTTKRWKRLDASPSLTCCELIFIWKNVVELLSARSWEFLELQWPSSLSGISLHWLLSSLRKRFVALYSGLTWLSTLYLNLLG